MKPNLVVVEDEEPLLELLRYNLEKAGYAVETLAHGDQAAARLEEVVPDLLVLDWMLPGVSGIELCRRLRQMRPTKSLPIIMLTARSEESDRVRGFDTGADDYVVKPFSVNELMARVAALLRRAKPLLVTEVLKVGDIELNRAAMVVLRCGQRVSLGPTDYRLLEFMMQSPGRVFSRAQLLDGVWGNEVYIDERTVDVHVGRLRKALLHGWHTDPIRTVRGPATASKRIRMETRDLDFRKGSRAAGPRPPKARLLSPRIAADVVAPPRFSALCQHPTHAPQQKYAHGLQSCIETMGV